MRFAKVWSKRERLTVVRYGFAKLAQIFECIPEVIVCYRMTGLLRNCVPVLFGCRLEFAQRL